MAQTKDIIRHNDHFSRGMADSVQEYNVKQHYISKLVWGRGGEKYFSSWVYVAVWICSPTWLVDPSSSEFETFALEGGSFLSCLEVGKGQTVDDTTNTKGQPHCIDTANVLILIVHFVKIWISKGTQCPLFKMLLHNMCLLFILPEGKEKKCFPFMTLMFYNLLAQCYVFE